MEALEITDVLNEHVLRYRLKGGASYIRDKRIKTFHKHSPRKNSKFVKQVKRHRDREPSRIPVKKVLNYMKKRKARSKLKFIFKKCTPKSSRLYDLVTHYKLWYIRYLQKCNAFITSLVNFKRLATKNSKKRKLTSSCCSGKIKKSTCPAKTYCVSRMNLLRSGDVELNPGPEQNVNNQTNLSVDSSTLLN